MKLKHSLLAILACQVLLVLSAIVTVSTILEVTETLPPGATAPTATGGKPPAVTTEPETTQHTAVPQTSQADSQHKTDAPPAPAPTTTVAPTDTEKGAQITTAPSTDTGLSTFSSTLTMDAGTTTTHGPALSTTESSPPPSADSTSGSSSHKNAIIGGVTACGAVLLALMAYLWWRLRRRAKKAGASSTPAMRSVNHIGGPSLMPNPARPASRLGPFNIFTDDAKYSNNNNNNNNRVSTRMGYTTDSKRRSLISSLYNDIRYSLTGAPPHQQATQPRLSISAPMPHPGHDTIASIAKGPYERDYETPRTPPPPPIPPPLSYQHRPHRSTTMSVIDEYNNNSSQEEFVGTEDCNQGYPMPLSPPPLRTTQTGGGGGGAGGNPMRALTPVPRGGLYESQSTAFPGYADDSASTYGALGNGTYLPPRRPNMGMGNNNNNNGHHGGGGAYVESFYSQYTDVRFDTDYQSPPTSQHRPSHNGYYM